MTGLSSKKSVLILSDELRLFKRRELFFFITHHFFKRRFCCCCCFFLSLFHCELLFFLFFWVGGLSVSWGFFLIISFQISLHYTHMNMVSNCWTFTFIYFQILNENVKTIWLHHAIFFSYKTRFLAFQFFLFVLCYRLHIQDLFYVLFGLLFNGISTFLGYLMPNPSF